MQHSGSFTVIHINSVSSRKILLNPLSIKAITSNVSIFSKMKMSLKETNESATNTKRQNKEIDNLASICNKFAHKRRPAKVKAVAISNKRGQSCEEMEDTPNDILSERAFKSDGEPVEGLDKMKRSNYVRDAHVEERTYIGDANDSSLVDGDKTCSYRNIELAEKNDLKTEAGMLTSNLNLPCENFESGFSKQGIDIDCVADGESSRSASTRSMTKRKLTQNGSNRSLRLGKRRKNPPGDAALEIEAQAKADCGKEKTKTCSPLALVKNSLNIDNYDEVYLDGVRYSTLAPFCTSRLVDHEALWLQE